MAREGEICNSKTWQVTCDLQSQTEAFPKSNNDFHLEIERIKSFEGWPVHYPVDPARLAKAGFYYTGYEDEVICFSCHGHIKNWNYGDVVQKKHAELFPHCDFINNKSNNVPVTKSSVKGHSNLRKAERLNDNFKQPKPKNIFDYDKMKSQKQRLSTFIGSWPLPYLTSINFANAGFFYLGLDDKVQCPYCKGVLSDWEMNDNPLEEHKKHFPWCEYLISPECLKLNEPNPCFQNSFDVCGNMPKPAIYDSDSMKHKLLDKSQQHTSLEKLGIHIHKGPAHPQQASIMARLRSFASWPNTAPVKKEDLAEAGFFYIGISDHTKCFHCNGGLCNWEDGDDPWTEHARWFCNCDFLHLNKGESFIEKCLQNYPPKCVSENSSDLRFSESLMKKIDDAMKSNLVKYVLETGLFPSYIVRAAVLRKLKETGSSFSNADELCLAVSQLKEEMEKEPVKMNDDLSKSVLENCVLRSDVSSLNCDTNVNSVHPEGDLEVKIGAFNGIPGKLSVVPNEENLSKDHCLCKICMDREVGVVFLPCGHLLSCTICAPALKFCPMCRKAIQATVRAYLN